MNSSPCAKLTTSMIPKIKVRPEATSARIMPVTMPLMVWISSWSNDTAWMKSTLHAHVLVDHPVVGAQFGRQGVMPDHPFFQDVDAPGRLQGKWNVLLDKQDRDMFAFEHADDLSDL